MGGTDFVVVLRYVPLRCSSICFQWCLFDIANLDAANLDSANRGVMVIGAESPVFRS
jgi:hypothetical protein